MDPMDAYLGKRMKNWVATHRPPANGKARLLRTAAQITLIHPREINRLPPNPDPFMLRILKSNANRHWHQDYSPIFFNWTIVYSFETSLANLRLMY